MASPNYESDAGSVTPAQRAAWLDECLELSALCLDLALSAGTLVPRQEHDAGEPLT